MVRDLFAVVLVGLVLLACACSDELAADPGNFEVGHELVARAERVHVHALTLNQAVAVPVILDGHYLDPTQRSSPLVANRAALARLDLDLEPGFRPHPILARLSLHPPDEPARIYERLVEPSHATDASVELLLEAEALRPGVRFSVELWEIDPAFAPDDPPREVASPNIDVAGTDPLDIAIHTRWLNDSRALLGVSDDPLTLHVVLVPITAAWPGCTREAPVDELRPAAHDALMAVNPVQTVRLETRAQAIVVETEPAHLSELFPALQAARDEDKAAPNTYYYGLFDACTGNVGGFGGLAFRAAVGPEPEAAWQRVAVGLHWPDAPDYTLQTLVHELGHLQGLRHVACPGLTGRSARAPDRDYPHAGGTIGTWGFDILTGTHHAPASTHDYMSYCYDSHWVSDWTWARTFDRIRTLSQWDVEEPLPERPTTTLLVGMIDEQGNERWWTRPGYAIEAESLAEPATLADGSTQLRGSREALADGGGELRIFALR